MINEFRYFPFVEISSCQIEEKRFDLLKTLTLWYSITIELQV